MAKPKKNKALSAYLQRPTSRDHLKKGGVVPTPSSDGSFDNGDGTSTNVIMTVSFALIAVLVIGLFQSLDWGISDTNVCKISASSDDGVCVSDTGPNEMDIDQHAINTCSLVMAPSGIPNGGWGVFTMKDRKRGERVSEQGTFT
jgi:hypothetical protein